ncbi:MAG: M20/M25/M40 family metallo-hydrolase [Acidobacteriia bacterium]|nr:M20/M25/M40 family metallo-hydrolase [Terriglobia bacterium]
MPLLLFLLLLPPHGLWADSAASARESRQWRRTHERAIVVEYTKLLSLPNVAGPNVARNVADMRRNAELIRAMLERRRIQTQLLEVEGAPPVIYGERLQPGAKRTVIFYVHYDGQPVDGGKWFNRAPFQPALMSGPVEAGGQPVALHSSGPFNPEWRLYARSASDDKAPIIALTTALDAMDAAGIAPGSNLKFFLDGEEEAGSPHMREFLAKYKHLLAGDVWIFCDGPVHQSRRQQIVFGARGSTALDVTIFGPRSELHSGHYGNWAPNPAMQLARLLATMKDDDGKVLIKDFYSDTEPLSAVEKLALAAVPNIDEEIRKQFWLGRTEGNGRRLDELINLPALNIQGITSAGTGDLARNVIPAQATAAIGLRLVKGNHYRRIQDRVVDHIRLQGFHVVEQEPSEATLIQVPKVCLVRRRSGYNGVRAPMDLPIAKQVVAAVEQARGPVIRMPTLGGSLPIAPIYDALQTPVLIVPIANHDNNQHSHNENLRLQNLWDGIETMAALLGMP